MQPLKQLTWPLRQQPSNLWIEDNIGPFAKKLENLFFLKNDMIG